VRLLKVSEVSTGVLKALPCKRFAAASTSAKLTDKEFWAQKLALIDFRFGRGLYL
jgi:hypothetical protein